jgi:hypothetical protein
VPGKRSASLGRTVRGHWADGLLPTGGRSVNYNRTTRRALQHTNGPYLVHGRLQATGAARTVRDVQADGPPNTYRPKTVGQPDRNKGAQEHATNTKNPRPTSSTRTVRTYQADCPPGANRRGNSNLRANRRAPYHLSFHGSPKRLELLRKGLGKM